MTELLNILKRFPAWGELPDDILQELTQLGELQTHQAGELLFREGEQHPYLYLLLSGQLVLEVQVHGRGGVELLTLTAGELVGWSPLIQARPMSLNATARSDLEVIRFDSRRLRELCESNHCFGYHFMRLAALAFAKRLSATRLQLLDLYAETERKIP